MQAAQQTSIGGYRVTGQLRAGGVGPVYTAVHESNGATVSLTVLATPYAVQRAVVDSYFEQSRAAAAIKHPGIYAIREASVQDGGPAFIAGEPLVGEYLDVRLGRGLLPVKQALRFAGQLANTLAAAHASGIVHRALAPDKVFLVRDANSPGGERVKVLDFGVAHFASIPNAQATQAATVTLSPKYMAPEQCQGELAVDHRADLYSLGCLMYALLCGRPPFDNGSDARAITNAHLQTPPPPPTSLRSELPRDIDAVLSYLLVKDPNRRYQSAVDLGQSLSVIAGEAITFTAQPGTVGKSPPSSAGVGPARPASGGPADGASKPAGVGAIAPLAKPLGSAAGVKPPPSPPQPLGKPPASSSPPPPRPLASGPGALARPAAPPVPGKPSPLGGKPLPPLPSPASSAAGLPARAAPAPPLPLAAPPPTGRVPVGHKGYDGPTDRMVTEPYMPDAPTRKIEPKLTPNDGVATLEYQPNARNLDDAGANERHTTTDRLDDADRLDAPPGVHARVLVRKVDPGSSGSNRARILMLIAGLVLLLGGVGTFVITQFVGDDTAQASAAGESDESDESGETSPSESPRPELSYVQLDAADPGAGSGELSEGRVRWQIASTPAGAEVYAGDQRVGTTPMAVELARTSGFTAEFVLRLEGYDDAKLEFTGDDSAETSPSLQARIPVVLESEPAGAEIFDSAGNSLGVTPAEIYLSQSDEPSQFTLELEGHEDGTIAIVPDEKKTHSVELQPLPATVTVRIDSEPSGATVEKSGEEVGTTPFEESFPEQKGKLRYTLKLDGYRSKSVRLSGGESAERTVKLKRKSKSKCPKSNSRSDSGGPVFVDPYDPCQ